MTRLRLVTQSAMQFSGLKQSYRNYSESSKVRIHGVRAARRNDSTMFAMYELLYLILYCVPPIVIGTLIVHYLYGGDTNLKMVFGTQLFLCIAMTSWFLFCAVGTYPEGVPVHIFLVLAILYSFSLTIKTFKKHHRQ